MPNIELGDIGTVKGLDGVWIVYAGASLPENWIACSRAARECAEPSDALNVYRHAQDGSLEHAIIMREEWEPWLTVPHD